MRPSKKPKYKLDIRKIYVRPKEELSAEELYKEQLTLKIKQRRK